MYSVDSNCLKEYNKIVVNDLMRLRQFRDINIEFIVDIGANIGIATIYFKTLFPSAKIISVEPDPQNFSCLQKNTHFISEIFIENKAFGSGKNCNIISRGNRLLDRYTVESDTGNTSGITMQDIFEKYKIDFSSKYLIKSDCEGAEKYFINNLYCENVIRNSEIFFMEIHFNSPGTPMFETTWDTYNKWIYDLFSSTHKIEYFVSNKKRGYGHYLLKRIYCA